MKEKEKYIKLFDIYGLLLTQRRRHIFELYYMCDLSLREIASNENITFQAVGNCIKKTQKQLIKINDIMKLDEYMEKVKLVKEELKKVDNKSSKLNDLLNDI